MGLMKEVPMVGATVKMKEMNSAQLMDMSLGIQMDDPTALKKDWK